MRQGLLVALTLIVATLFTPLTAQAAFGDITGSLPAGGGVSIVVWGGGSTAQIASSAQQRGCSLGAAWVLDGATQEFVGNVYGAPAIVNAQWSSRFPGDVPATTLLILVCRAPHQAAPAPTPAPAAAPGAQSQERELARLITTGVNSERTKRGLTPLRDSAILTTTAERYAPTQLAAGRLDHSLDGEVWDRARAAGYPSFNVGEVLAARIFTGPFNIGNEATKFVEMWMGSPPHRAILMSEDIAFEEVGYGCVISTRNGTEIYCVGVTGKP